MKFRHLLFPCFLLLVSSLKGQVVINEVHPRPAGGDTDQAFQSMYNSTATSGSEFVEIYNTDPCNDVDISCWSIGGMDGGTNGGSFSFPAGTMIPPLGFITLGGPNTPGITFNLNQAANSALLWRSNANRWHLPNGDGWLSLYDATGNSVDAVYWTFAANDPTKLNNDATFTDGVLQRIASCGGGPLATASGIPGIEYINSATSTGLSFERTTDGTATWALGVATPNDCNGICVTSSAFELNATVQQPSCGASDGSITFNPTPAGVYSYTWSPNVAATNSASNLGAGSYDISITLNGCTIDTTIVLTSGNGVSSALITVVDADCGQANGEVTISAITGGQGPYEINFNGLGFGSATNYPNLAAGSYTVIIQDANGCQYTAPNAVVGNGAGPTFVQVTSVSTSCGLSNGSIDIEAVNGGMAPYQFNVGGQGFSTITNYTNLPAGTYSLIVIDDNGCSYTAQDVIINPSSNPTGIVVTTSNPACGEADGSITLGAVAGGAAPYQYNFNGQGFSSSISYTGLLAGSYTLVIRDVNGCEYTAPNVILTTSTGPTALLTSSIDATCGETNGSITIENVTGGTSPYLYSLNGGAFSSSLLYTDLGAGNYDVTVQDAAGCEFQVNELISGGISPIADFSMSPSSVPIYNPVVQLIDGSSSDVVSYEWSIPNGMPSSASTPNLQTVFENLTTGFYPITLIVTNAEGCTDTVTKLIELYDEILIFAPNAFTPDGDEYNNGWGVVVSGADLSSFHLLIFDRWGEIIFESYDYSAFWDGTYHGKLVQDGIYTWSLSLKELRNDDKHEYRGHITVIR
jgi:gliding motility-associated-like protein